MGRLEAMGSEPIPERVEFPAGSRGDGPRESVNQEQRKREKEARDFGELMNEIQGSGCDQLASYLTGLSPDERTKIDVGLNPAGIGIAKLMWVEPGQQNEIIGLLGEIVQAQDTIATKNARERVSILLE